MGFALGRSRGRDRSRGHFTPPTFIYSAGPFSDSNYLLAAGTGPQMTPGASTLTVRFRMNSALVVDGYLCGRMDATRGWAVGLTASNGHVSFFARGVPTFPAPIILDAGSMAGIEHCFCITDDGTSYRYAANGGPVTTLVHGAGAYVPATAATDFRIGRIYLTSAAAVKADVLDLIVNGSTLTDPQITLMSSASRRGDFDPTLAAAAVCNWRAGRDLIPGAATSVSSGTSPVTFAVQGTVPRTARSRWAGADLSRSGASAFSDTAAPVLQTGADGVVYGRRSELCRLTLTTDATILSVQIAGSEFTFSIASAFIEVQVNGSHQTTVPIVISDVAQSFDITLPAGAKTVTLIEGTQSNTSAPALGDVRSTSILGVSVPPGNTFAIVAPAAVQHRLVILADSIPGYGPTSPQVNSLISLVRADFPTTGTGGVTAEAWGSRSLYEAYLAGGNTWTAFVAKIVTLCDGTVLNSLWIALGTNDYGIGAIPNTWNAAAFQAAYTALLIALRAALPSLAIYCQSMIARVAPALETINGAGSTCAQYRTAISNSVTAANVGATFVDGSGFVSPANYDASGLHENNAGAIEHKAAVKTAMGY